MVAGNLFITAFYLPGSRYGTIHGCGVCSDDVVDSTLGFKCLPRSIRKRFMCFRVCGLMLLKCSAISQGMFCHSTGNVPALLRD